MPQRKRTRRGDYRPKLVRSKAVVGKADLMRAMKKAALSSQELKFHDVTISDATLANNWTILNSGTLLVIAAGTGESERVGRKVTVRKIGFRYTIGKLFATTSTATSTSVRVIVYHDKQANKATAALADIVEDDTFYTFNNLTNSGRFRTLMDRTHDLASTCGGGDGTTEDYGENISSHTWFKECNIPVEYTSTTGAIGEITSNNICVMAFSSENANVRLDGNFRFRFTDS